MPELLDIPLPPDPDEGPETLPPPELPEPAPRRIPAYIAAPTMDKRYSFKEALVGARPFIADMRHDYLCHAMAEFALEDFFGQPVADEVWMNHHSEAAYVMADHITRVETMILPFYTYINWLEKKIGEEIYNPRMSRLKWIDELIAKEK